MSNSIQKLKCKFRILFVSIFVLLVCIYFLYLPVFNGKLSHEISDWTVFVNIFNGIGVFLLTALNVWIFYKLTILIAENEEKHRLYGQKKDMLNNFARTIYLVFTPDSENPTCDIHEKNLTRVYYQLQLMQEAYAPICKVFGEDDFKQFVDDYHEFCKEFFFGDAYGREGKPIEGIAFQVFQQALNLELKIAKDINISIR